MRPFCLILLVAVCGCQGPNIRPKAPRAQGIITASEALAIAKKQYGGRNPRYDFEVKRDGREWQVWIMPFGTDDEGRHGYADDSGSVMRIDEHGKVLEHRAAF